MTMIDWKQLDEGDYSKLRKELLEKNAETQREFLEQVRDGNAFLQRMNDIKCVGNQSAGTLETPLCEGEFNSPPCRTEERIYEKWKGLTPAIASKAGFWAYLTMDHIRQGKIEASFLARNNQAHQTGAERIDRAIEDSEKDSQKSLDDCVRTILRQLGGLPEARGRRSVLCDCPISRAWWRTRLITRATKRQSRYLSRQIGRSLRESKTHWEKLASVIVSRNPVLGYAHVQDALLVALAKPFEDTSIPSMRIPADRIWEICQPLCILSGSRELGILDYEEVLKLIEPIVARTMSKHDLSQ